MKKNSITLLVLVVVLVSWFLFCTPLRAASIHFDFITDEYLLNMRIGLDGIWGTDDDLYEPPLINTSAAASFTWPDPNYLTGYWEATLPTPAPGTGSIDAYYTHPQSGPDGYLNTTEERTITFTDPHHYTSVFTITSDTTDHPTLGMGGYAIYNISGHDDPSIFAGEYDGWVEGNFNFLLTIVDPSWTSINIEYLRFNEYWPDQGTALFSWTSDPEVLNTVPIPGSLWLLGSGLIGLVAFRRKLRKS